jgi:hypothetical protein
MSFKPEVQTDDTGKWYGNALRFGSREEAEAQVQDLIDAMVCRKGNPRRRVRGSRELPVRGRAP